MYSDDWLKYGFGHVEWMKFLKKVLKNSHVEKTPNLLKKFLYENKGLFAFEDALDTYQIKYDKIAFFVVWINVPKVRDLYFFLETIVV